MSSEKYQENTIAKIVETVCRGQGSNSGPSANMFMFMTISGYAVNFQDGTRILSGYFCAVLAAAALAGIGNKAEHRALLTMLIA